MNEKTAVSWLTSDTGVIGQYWDTVTRKTNLEPEKELMLAVLKDALLIYRRNVSSPNALFYDVEHWVFDKDTDRLFSFEMVCEVLNLSPSRIRAGVLGWKSRTPTLPTIQGRRSRSIDRSNGKKTPLLSPDELLLLKRL